jgi:hypothetical protein
MTRYTPYEILFGRKANIPGHLQQTAVPVYNYDDLVYDVKRKLQECHEIARANVRQTSIELQNNLQRLTHLNYIMAIRYY